METIMIRCPNTGRDISTGLIMRNGEFSRSPVFFARVLCPICAEHHEWFAADAWARNANETRRDEAGEARPIWRG